MARAASTRTSRSSRGSKAKGLSVDFTGVEASGKVAEGRQIVTVDGAPEVKTGENSGNDYLNWKFKADGGSIYHTTTLQPQGLWNLRNVLEAMGVEVPEGKMDLDLESYDGLTLGVEVEHETYQGKKKPRIIDVFPEEELDDDGVEAEEEEEEPAKGKSKPAATKGKPAPKEEPEDDITYEEVMEMEKDELLELAEENEIKVPVKTKRNVDALRELIVAELELEAGEADESDLTYEEVMEMEKDELLEVAEENEIKVPVKAKRDVDALRELVTSELGLEAPAKTKPAGRTASRKTATKDVKKGANVTFTDDGEELEGTVKSVNAKEGFAVLDVDGEEWEVELADITVQ